MRCKLSDLYRMPYAIFVTLSREGNLWDTLACCVFTNSVTAQSCPKHISLVRWWSELTQKNGGERAQIGLDSILIGLIFAYFGLLNKI